MTVSSSNPLFIFGFLFFAVAFVYGPVLYEYMHAHTWNPSYFRQGIPLLKKHFHLTNKFVELDSFAKPLEEHLRQNHQYPLIVFKPLNSHELAFRQDIVDGEKNHFTFFMHGLISANPMDQKLSLIGYYSYPTISFTILMIILLFWAVIASLGASTFPTLAFVWTPFFLYSIGKSVVKCRTYYSNMEVSVQFVLRDFLDNNDQIFASKNFELGTGNPSSKIHKGLNNLEKALIIILVALLILVAFLIGIFGSEIFGF